MKISISTSGVLTSESYADVLLDEGDLTKYGRECYDKVHALVFRVKSNKQSYLEHLVDRIEHCLPYLVVEYELVRDASSWYAMIVLDIPHGRTPLNLASFKGKSSAQTQRNTFGAPGPQGLKAVYPVKPQSSQGTFGPVGLDATNLRSGYFYSTAASPEPGEDQGHWVIGDVHGNVKTLKALVQKIAPAQAWALGDYIDKGPDSKGVLDFLMKNQDTITALRGNHEQMLLYAWANPGGKDDTSWQTRHGGSECLQSFGITDGDVRKIPKKYIRFIKSMPYGVEVDNYILSHAGADLSKKNPLKDSAKNRAILLWNRHVKPDPTGTTRMVVGHTPTKKKQAKASIKTGMVYIDGGAGNGPGGSIRAYNLHTHQLVSVKVKDVQ